MSNRQSKIWLVVMVGLIALGAGLWRFISFAQDHPQEATWGIAFYGMIFGAIGLPIGVIALIVSLISKRRRTIAAKLQQHED